MIKKLIALCVLSAAVCANTGSVKEINLLCRYANTSSDAVALTLNLDNSVATSVTLVGEYVGAVSIYRIIKTSDEYILKDGNADGTISTPYKGAISMWSLGRQDLKATWKLNMYGKLAVKKEATCRLFEPENKI